jgi:hypothetical protein
MGMRSDLIRKYFIDPTPECLIMLEVLEVLEEILEELRVQNDLGDEEQGHTSLSDQ